MPLYKYDSRVVMRRHKTFEQISDVDKNTKQLNSVCFGPLGEVECNTIASSLVRIIYDHAFIAVSTAMDAGVDSSESKLNKVLKKPEDRLKQLEESSMSDPILALAKGATGRETQRIRSR